MGSLRRFFHCLVVLVLVLLLGRNWTYFQAAQNSDTSLDDEQSLPLLESSNIHGSQNSSISTQVVSSKRFSLSKIDHGNKLSNKLKFYLVAPPEYTTTFVLNHSARASTYYTNHLNEESAEVWLHRGFSRMTYDQGQALNPEDSHAILISGYFHLNAAMHKPKGKGRRIDHSQMLLAYQSELDKIHDNSTDSKSKPHLLLIPSWNPSVANDIGLKPLASRLQERGYSNLWSVGFERNAMWQGVPIERILPIPYVVRPPEEAPAFSNSSRYGRTSNFVFYAGDVRRNAKAWAGCHRDSLILPLQNSTLNSLDVRLVNKTTRIEQTEYNHRMKTSDYCLVLCGDTPSSRSLTSAMVSGCIPIRVGSRLRGLCELPCHRGFGWKPTGVDYPHLPYPERIPWDIFPEVDEQRFMDAGKRVLKELYETINDSRKIEIRSIMDEVRNGWIYGWGDPMNSTNFGEASLYIWDSFASALSREKR